MDRILIVLDRILNVLDRAPFLPSETKKSPANARLMANICGGSLYFTTGAG